MRNKFVLIVMSVTLLGFVMVPDAGAAMYTGSIAGGDGLYGSSAWSTATLSWTVGNTTNADDWTYAYTFSVPRKGISHVILETSETFTLANLISETSPVGQVDPMAPMWYGNMGKSNTGMPDDLFGIKWDDMNCAGNVLSFTSTFVSDRAPMWGDFYAKGGKSAGKKVYAYNTNFGSDPIAIAIGDGNAGGWVLVPDTNGLILPDINGSGAVVPLPPAIWLLSSGLLGIAGYRRKMWRLLQI